MPAAVVAHVQVLRAVQVVQALAAKAEAEEVVNIKNMVQYQVQQILAVAVAEIGTMVAEAEGLSLRAVADLAL
jgi:hypothetical protein